MKFSLYLGALVSSLLLSGCGDSGPENLLADYRDRIANVLEVEPPEMHPLSIPALPPRRERIQSVKDLRSGILDTLQFKTCDLLPLIVERNGSLGKVMQPSQLMSYEIRFFNRLQPCYQKALRGELTDIDEQFMSLLRETYEIKSGNLPQVIWNGIFTSEEMEKQFSQAEGPLPIEGNPGFQASLAALQYFLSLTQQSSNIGLKKTFMPPPGFDHQEDFYFSLYASHYGSQLQASLGLLAAQLNQVAAMINQKLDQRPLCFNKKSNSKADILLNVFNRYYAARVQPYMAMVQQQGRQWFGLMNQLLTFNAERRSKAMQNYSQHVYQPNGSSSPWHQYQQAIKTHTLAWQRVLGQCGLMPSG